MTPEAFAYKNLLTSHEPKFFRRPLTFRPKNKFPSNFGKFFKDTVKNLKLHRYSLVATRISRTAFLYKDMRMLSSTTLPQSLQSSTSTPPAARKRGKQARKIDLLKLAKATGCFETKKEAREALKGLGFVCTPAAVDELLDASTEIGESRKSRRNRVIQEHLGYLPKLTYQAHTGPMPVLLPKGQPMDRLIGVKKKAVTAMAHSLMRHGASGGHTVRVEFALDASKVDYVVVMGQNRDTYGGSFKGWSANEDHHRITVPSDWRLRVERKGLARLGGMMTLDAHPLMSNADVVLYAATWARQGRGYDVKVDRGFIAMLDGEHFHGDSAQAAIKGVRRKLKAAGMTARTVTSPYALTVDAFVKRYAGRKISVSVSDAQESGSCDFGIRSWCEYVGIDYDEQEAPLDAVLAGFKARPQDEVRRAVLYAVRRHRAERRVSNS
jgi:hypothetical protein